MLVILLVLAPLRAQVAFCLNFAQKELTVNAKVFHIKVFKEKFTLQGKYLNCQGSVDTQIDLTQMDPSSGKAFMKAIVIDSVNVNIAVNYLAHKPTTMLAVESFAFLATAIACLVSNCRIHTSTQMATQTAVSGEVHLSVSLAEVFLALFRSARSGSTI